MRKIYHIINIVFFVCFSTQLSAFEINNNFFNIKGNGHVNFSSSNNNQKINHDHETKVNNSYLNDNAINHYSKINISIDSAKFFVKGLSLNSSIQYNIDSNQRKKNIFVDDIFLKKKFSNHKFEIGSLKAVNQLMKYGPSRVTRGSGGVRGKYLEYVNYSNKVANYDNNFIMLGQSPIGHNIFGRERGKNVLRSMDDDSFDGIEDALKLNYYHYFQKNFTFGASYTPDLNNNLNNISFNNFKNIINIGLNYKKYLDNGAKIVLASTAESAKSNNKIYQDLLAYDLSSTISYFGFDFAILYGQWLKSGNLKDRKSSKSQYISSALSYNFGPIGASISQFNSEIYNNKYQAIAMGFDYKINKKILAFIELTKFNFNSNNLNAKNIIRNNNGYILLTGINYNF